MKYFNKKIIRKLLIVFGTLVIALLLFFDKVDNSPYQESQYYKQTINTFSDFDARASHDTSLLAGWGKENITPDFPIKTAGYGLTKPFRSVGDSIYLRTLVLANRDVKVAVITADLLIFPPELAQDLERNIKNEFPEMQFYFGATHTHSSVGGWTKGLVGTIMSGGFHQEYYDLLLQRSLRSVKKAVASLSLAEVSFGNIDASALVENRLVKDQGVIYPWFNNIKIRKESGGTAVVSSFSAHATCDEPKNGVVSGDYPGKLVEALESGPEIDFAAFLAGPVGSHGPRKDLTNKREFLSKAISDSLQLKFTNEPGMYKPVDARLQFVKKEVSLREPHFRVGTHMRFRPWVYNMIMGSEQEIGLRFLKIGKLLLVGTPCDFSGELVPQLDSIAKENGLHLMVTSFNGAYIGYITKDDHYNLPKSETRDMNWFGPENGKYFSELISKGIELLGNQ